MTWINTPERMMRAKMNRRALILSIPTVLAASTAAKPASLLKDARLRGGVENAASSAAAGLDKSSRSFQSLLDEASRAGKPLDLPASTFTVSNIVLPKWLVVRGVPGKTRIVYGGDGTFLSAEVANGIVLEDLVLDGMNRWLDDATPGLIDFRGCENLVMSRCIVTGSARNGVHLERSHGRISDCTITGAFDAGIWSVEGRDVTISGNRIADCGNGGILVHRWQDREDGTIVSGNRIERIRAANGGTGQYGNGINIFRAAGVSVTGNSIADCAFSAIRANSASGIRIADNRCLRSGETAIYSEFSFEGAVIASNLVDGAANGISAVNYDQGGRLATITGNIVRNLSTEGPYSPDSPGFGAGITAEADTVITGNIVENAPLWGIGIGWGPYLRDVSATANVLRDCRIGIAVSVVEGAGSALVSDNLISGARDGAIVGHRWAEAATGDLAAGRNRFDHLSVERNRVS